MDERLTKNLSFRLARLEDVEILQTLFVDTINSACKKDYSPEQLSAWTASVHNTKRWTDLLRDQYVLLAIYNKTIVAFASLKNGTYLDFFYVHKDFQGMGVASKLYQKMEAAAKAHDTKTLSSDISITAKPFFESRGFVSLREQKNQVRGVELINYKMVKDLSRS